jgi:hypothetical protein
LWAVLSRALRRSRLRTFGPANRVILGHATPIEAAAGEAEVERESRNLVPMREQVG